MKSALLLFFLASVAQAQTFVCEGGAGGPAPAQATMVTQTGCGVTFVSLKLVNVAVPSGLDGHFMSQTFNDPADASVSLPGKIGDVDGNIILSPADSDGKVRIAIYAGMDNRIEFGFGAHLTCTPVN